MTTLSTILVEENYLTLEQVEDALHRQMLVGGDLPTVLLERGLLTEEILLRAVARQHNLEPCPVGALAYDATISLDEQWARRQSVLVLTREDRGVVVAVQQPLTPRAKQELEEIVRVDVHQQVALAHRVQQGIAHRYGSPLPERLRALLVQLDGTAGEPSSAVRPPVPSGESAAEPRPPQKPVAAKPPIAAGPSASAPQPTLLLGPLTPGEAELRLREGKTASELTRVFFHFAQQYFVNTALFRVQTDELELVESALDSVARGTGVGETCPLPRKAAELRGPQLTSLAASDGAEGMLRLLRRPRVDSCLLLPVMVGPRTVMLLHGDHGSHATQLDRVGEVLAFSGVFAAALTELARRRRGAMASPSLAPQPKARPSVVGRSEAMQALHGTLVEPTIPRLAPLPSDLGVAPVAEALPHEQLPPSMTDPVPRDATFPPDRTTLEGLWGAVLEPGADRPRLEDPTVPMPPVHPIPGSPEADAQETAPAPDVALVPAAIAASEPAADRIPTGASTSAPPTQASPYAPDAYAALPTELQERSPVEPHQSTEPPPDPALPIPLARRTRPGFPAPQPEPAPSSHGRFEPVPSARGTEIPQASQGDLASTAEHTWTEVVVALFEGREDGEELVVAAGEVGLRALLGELRKLPFDAARFPVDATASLPIYRSLRRLEHLALPAFRRAVTDPSAHLRAWAQWFLRRLVEPRDLLVSLTMGLVDTDSTVRQLALATARRFLRSEELRPALESLIYREVADPTLRIPARLMALRSLEDLNLTGAVPELLDILQFEVGEIHAAAWKTLQAITGERLGDDLNAWRGWWAAQPNRN